VPGNTTSGINGDAENRPRTTGKRILVIEDNRDAADSLRLVLVKTELPAESGSRRAFALLSSMGVVRARKSPQLHPSIPARQPDSLVTALLAAVPFAG
jgi:hypothetical protein